MMRQEAEIRVRVILRPMIMKARKLVRVKRECVHQKGGKRIKDSVEKFRKRTHFCSWQKGLFLLIVYLFSTVHSRLLPENLTILHVPCSCSLRCCEKTVIN